METTPKTLSSFSKIIELTMIKKNYRLQLAKMLKLYKEYSTDEAMLIVESDKDTLEVGDEVFVETEEGVTPAQDGEYNDTVNNKIYVVAGGTITEIREKEQENNAEEGNQEGNQEGSQEENMENNEGSDNGSDNGNSQDGTGSTSEMETENETLKAENEALKSKVAELEATVSDLEDQIAAYKAKEEETEPSAEEAEKFASMKPKTELEKKLETAKLLMKAIK